MLCLCFAIFPIHCIWFPSQFNEWQSSHEIIYVYEIKIEIKSSKQCSQLQLNSHIKLYGKCLGYCCVTDAYNDDKSTMMVICQRLANVKWQLWDKLLSETKRYNYFGVIINRTLRGNDHINSQLWEKDNKSDSYIRYIMIYISFINQSSIQL